MVGTVIEFDADVDDGITGEHAVSHGFFDALFNRLDVFARDGAALNSVDEFKAFAGFILEQAQPNVTVLAAATGLADEFTLDFDSVFTDGFTVGNLWLANVSVNAKLA